MIADKMYATVGSFNGFSWTDSAINIQSDFSDIAYPYYMGYIKSNEIPTFYRPKKFTEDSQQSGLYHVTDAYPEQNASWLYMRNNGATIRGQNIYKDGNTWNRDNISTNPSFLNSGVMANINLYNPANIVVIYCKYDTINDTTTDAQILTISVSYNTLKKLIDGTGTITVNGYTISKTDFVESRNCYVIVEDDYEHIIAFSFFNNYFYTYTSNSTTVNYFPVVKIENADKTEINLIKAQTYEDFRLWIKASNDSVKFFENLTVSGSTFGNTVHAYNHPIWYGTSDIDVNFMFNHRGGTYYHNNMLYSQSGYLIYDGNIWYGYVCYPFVNPFDFLRLLNLYNKITYTQSLQSRTGYETGIAVSFFDENNSPLYTGKTETETYSYNDIFTDLKIWQRLNIDITVNDYDDSTKPSPTPEPTGGIDTNPEETGTNLPDFTSIRRVSGNAFNSFYKVPLVGVEEMGYLLSQSASTFWQALGTATDDKQSNLLEYIVSLKWYPVDFENGTTGTIVQFGYNGNAQLQFSAGVVIEKIDYCYQYISMGNVFVPTYLDNVSFLDFEPYTECMLYLPYIGFASVPSNKVIGHTISFDYIIDITTGIATAFVSNGQTVIFTGTGQIGVDIAVSGNDIITQSQQISSAVISGTTKLLSGAMTAGFSVASENAVGAIGSIAGTMSGIAETAISVASAKRGKPLSVSSGSGFGASFNPQTPCILVERDCIKIPSDYGHTVGYISGAYAKVSDLSGYSEIENPDLSGISGINESEMQLLADTLKSGFYA